MRSRLRRRCGHRSRPGRNVAAKYGSRDPVILRGDLAAGEPFGKDRLGAGQRTRSMRRWRYGRAAGATAHERRDRQGDEGNPEEAEDEHCRAELAIIHPTTMRAEWLGEGNTCDGDRGHRTGQGTKENTMLCHTPDGIPVASFELLVGGVNWVRVRRRKRHLSRCCAARWRWR